MDTRPNKKKYHGLISGAIVTILASILLIAGIVFIVMGFTARPSVLLIPGFYLGGICIVLSALLFIISNIAEDIHWRAYLAEYYGEEQYNYHMMSLQKLQNIESLFCQKQPNPPSSFRESAELRQQTRYFYREEDQQNNTTDIQNAYKAQFKYSTSKKNEEKDPET